jgi:universal stress protein
MYKRILVPTDGSERSVKAVEGAARFARPLGATLVVMTVVEPYSYTNLAEYRPESIEQYDERVTAEAEERLEAARKIAVAAGVEVKTVMVKSFSPAEAIIEQAEKKTAVTSFSWQAMAVRASLQCFWARKRRRCSRTRISR